MSEEKRSEKELVLSARNKDDIAFRQLLEKYTPFARNLAHDYVKNNNVGGIDYNEFYIVCIEAIVVAIRKFDFERENFYPYWKAIAEKMMLKYMKENSYFYGAKMFSGLSLDETQETCKYGNANFIGAKDQNIKGNLVYSEMNDIMINKKYGLTDIEIAILKLLIDGYEISEIATKLKVSASKVYAARKTLRKKLQKELSDSWR